MILETKKEPKIISETKNLILTEFNGKIELTLKQTTHQNLTK